MQLSRLMKDGDVSAPSSPAPSTSSTSNPFFRSQTAHRAACAAHPRYTPPVKTAYHTVPSGSDEEIATRDTRVGLAQQLFGSLIPAWPQST